MNKAGVGFGLLAVLALAAAWIPQERDLMKERLRVSLKDHDLKGPWIYDDIAKGFAESEKTGKPLMVVFRCVP